MPEPPATEDAPAPAGRSFLIGCVIGIVVTALIGMVVFVWGTLRARARADRTRVLLSEISREINRRAGKGEAPRADGSGSDFSGQEALRAAGVLLPEAHIVDGLVVDAWENPLVYRCPDGRDFQLYSRGPNARDDGGTFDDIPAPE